MWDRSGSSISDQAIGQPKDGLLVASIDMMRPGSDPQRIVECTGQDFMAFKWRAVYSGSTGQTRHEGLVLMGRYEEITAWYDGRVTKEKRTDEFSYPSFGR